MPLSGDDQPGRPAPRKQAGSPGATLSWAEPDEIRDYYPAGACSCGADLAGAAGLGVARSAQQVELPDVAARRIQHDMHRARYGCGREHVAARPPGAGHGGQHRPGLRALAVYLVIFQHGPVERYRLLIADVIGARVSDGFIHSCLARAADVKLIKTLITAAHVAGFDETTLRCGPAGKKKYVLGAFTDEYSLFFLGQRTLESSRDFGILTDFAGVQ